MLQTTSCAAAQNSHSQPESRSPTFAGHRLKTLQRGFSLVEIALVLMIAGLALGAGVAVLSAKFTQAKIDVTKARAESIRVALTNYVSQNYRLPCPAAPGIVKGENNYNTERRTGTAPNFVCDAVNGLNATIGGTGPSAGVSRGTVPCITLGIAEDMCTDGYGNRFTYFVDNRAVNLTSTTVSGMRGLMTIHKITPPAAATPTAGLAPTGNQTNACSITAGDNSCNSLAVAIIISHGANRGGGYSPVSTIAHLSTTAEISIYEQLNVDNDFTFLQNDYVEKGDNSFDDIIAVVVPRELITSLSQANIVKDPRAVTGDRFPQIKAALLTKMFESTPLAPQGTVNDRGFRLAVGSGTGTNQTNILSISSTAKCPSVNTQTLELPTVVDVPSLSIASGLREDGWGRPIRYKLYATNGVAKVADPLSCTVETTPPTALVSAHICIPASPPVPPPPPPAIPASAARDRLGSCTTPFILISDGPDRLPDTLDDIYYVVLYDELQQYVKNNNGW